MYRSTINKKAQVYRTGKCLSTGIFLLIT